MLVYLFATVAIDMLPASISTRHSRSVSYGRAWRRDGVFFVAAWPDSLRLHVNGFLSSFGVKGDVLVRVLFPFFI